jgi:hypothetical protein
MSYLDPDTVMAFSGLLGVLLIAVALDTWPRRSR